MIDRHKARTLAMQALCQFDVQGDGVEQDLPSFLADSGADQSTAAYARILVAAVRSAQDVIDEQITQHCSGWSIKRMAPVERNVLRVALAEMQQARVPLKVIINEAIEISREFGAAESAGFVNGVLDAIAGNRPKGT